MIALQPGDINQNVRELQSLLTSRQILSGGFAPGFMDEITVNAVRLFQKQNGLLDDGIVGSKTWSALKQAKVDAISPNALNDRLVASIPDATIRKFARQSIPLILGECQQQGVGDNGQIAYILATAEHESHLGQWMVELASGYEYNGRSDLGNNQPGDGPRYKGRGYVQITGRVNYQRWSDSLKLDLIGSPEMTAEPEIAAKILVVGMRDGSFTGLRLGQYINGSRQDFVGARRIINGTDRAARIAAIAEEYRRVLDEGTP